MRAKSVLLLLLALGCGLVASIGITQVMAKRNSDTANPAAKAEAIYVALTDIPTGDAITAEMLSLEPWPKDRLPEGALMKLEDVEGRRPRSKIFKGEPILENKLLGKGISEGGAAPQIPVGCRVVSVRVDEEKGTSNLIRPGDRVDVLLYLKSMPGTILGTCTRTILQDIKVFAVNDVFNLDELEGAEDQRLSARTISLLVKPDQAELVMLATELGTIRLSLRSHEDKDKVDLAGAFPHELDKAEPSNRADEELVRPPTSAGNPNDLSNFINLLKSQGQPTQTPAESTDKATWGMRIIREDQVDDVFLESPNGTSTSGAQPVGLKSFWRLIPSTQTQNSEPAAVRPDTEETASGAQASDKEKQGAEKDAETDTEHRD